MAPPSNSQQSLQQQIPTPIGQALRTLDHLEIPGFATYYSRGASEAGIVAAGNSHFDTCMRNWGKATYINLTYDQLHDAAAAKLYSGSDAAALANPGTVTRPNEGYSVDVVKVALPGTASGSFYVLGFFVVYGTDDERCSDNLDSRLCNALTALEMSYEPEALKLPPHPETT